MKKILVLMLAGVLLTGCATTHFEIDPETKQVRGNTYTLFKKVEGFKLTWGTDEDGNPNITVALDRSDPATELITAIAPILRELAPMAEALTRAQIALAAQNK